MKTLADADRLRDRILTAYERAAEAGDRHEERRWTTFVIVGGGPTGVELAGQLATVAKALHRDFRRIDTAAARIVVVEASSTILGAFSESLRAHAHRALRAMGVEIRVDTSAAGVDERGVDLHAKDGGVSRIEAGTVIWAAGVKPAPLTSTLADAAGVDLDHKGRIEVGPDCSLPGHPNVFAIGDMANVDDLPGLAEPAMQEGLFVGRVLRARVAGRTPPKRFRYVDLGDMAAISPGDAVADIHGLHLKGPVGKVAWGVVHLAFLATWGSRASVLGHWVYELATRRLPARAILETVDAHGLVAPSSPFDASGLIAAEPDRIVEPAPSASAGST
jgi:NADH dehydrogenase